MTERGLLTESERDILAGEDGQDTREELHQQLQDRVKLLGQDMRLLAEEAPELFERVQTQLEAVQTEPDTGGSGESTDKKTLGELAFPHDDENCKAAVYSARDYIRANEGATRNEIVSQVMPVHPLTYQVDTALRTIEAGEAYTGGWWSDVVRPGLEALPTVECPPDESEQYRYVSDN